MKKFWELAILKNVVFLSRPFWIFFFKIFFCFIPMKTCQSLLVSKDGSKMITLVSSQKSLPPNISATSVMVQKLFFNICYNKRTPNFIKMFKIVINLNTQPEYLKLKNAALCKYNSLCPKFKHIWAALQPTKNEENWLDGPL